jgi:transposase
MFSLSGNQRYYLYHSPCDMRKGFDGLYGLVTSELKRRVVNGSVFVFINRKRTHIKLLHWEDGGLDIYHKRLEQGRFEIPKLGANKNQLSWPELVMLIEGINILSVKRKPRFQLQDE